MFAHAQASGRHRRWAFALPLYLGVPAIALVWLNDAVVRLAGLYGSDFALAGVPTDDALSLLLGGVLLGYIGAWLAVARHLSELAPK